MEENQPVFDIEELTCFVESDSIHFVDTVDSDLDMDNLVVPQVSLEIPPMDMEYDEGISLDFSTSSDDNHDHHHDQIQGTAKDDLVEKEVMTANDHNDLDVVSIGTIAIETNDDDFKSQVTFEEKQPVKKKKKKGHVCFVFPWEDINEDPPVAKVVDDEGLRKPLLCELCGKFFSENRNLNRHQAVIHKGLKRFKCDLCGKMFSEKRTLKRHDAIIHQGLKRFKCDLCEKSYYETGSMKKHMKVHTGVKPFNCEICGKRFNHKSDLKKHSNGHIRLYLRYQEKMRVLDKSNVKLVGGKGE